MTDTPRDGRRWATRAEAAEYARVSDDTLDAWCSDRDVPVTRYSAGKRRAAFSVPLAGRSRGTAAHRQAA